MQPLDNDLPLNVQAQPGHNPEARGGVAQLVRANGSYPLGHQFKSDLRYQDSWQVADGGWQRQSQEYKLPLLLKHEAAKLFGCAASLF